MVISQRVYLPANVTYLFIISIIINVGMWFEQFVIFVMSLYRDYLPSSWGTYRATLWDYMLFIGILGIFSTLFLLFVRFAPMIPMNEIKTMLPEPTKPETDVAQAAREVA